MSISAGGLILDVVAAVVDEAVNATLRIVLTLSSGNTDEVLSLLVLDEVIALMIIVNKRSNNKNKNKQN
jgi:hypothetical protein